MYAQLGTIRFEGLNGFSTLEESFAVNYAQHERINGKPRLEAVGDVLDTISFDMYLHSSFVDPEASIEVIRTAMINREILTLILGSGKVVGNFVIPNFTKSTEFTDPNGNIISATLSIELLESATDDPLASAKKSALNSSFATANRNANVRTLLPAKQSEASFLTSGISEMETNSKKVTDNIKQVEINSATSEYNSAKIDLNLDAILSSLDSSQNLLTQAQDFQNLAPNLQTAFNGVYTAVQNMKAVLPITDVSSFQILNRQLSGSIASAKSSSIGITNQAIIRRK